VAIAMLAKVLADDALTDTLGFRPRRYRVHLRAVDDVDAGVARTVDLGKDFALGVLFTPGPGTQTHDADLESAGAEGTIEHVGLRSGGRGSQEGHYRSMVK